MVDFERLNQSLPTVRVLDALGLERKYLHRTHWRGRCPFHDSASGNTLSIGLAERKWMCHSRGCLRHGDLIDLWAGVRCITLVQAAAELAAEFGAP